MSVVTRALHALGAKAISSYRSHVLQKPHLRHNAELTHFASVNKLLNELHRQTAVKMVR
jgi:hypothetical protein